jgi:XTP/dITP diphosphohydrolase
VDSEIQLPETRETIEGNARQKVEYMHELWGYDGFADDTGLEVKVLGGAPGVYSARYAGPECTPRDNINKLLNELKEEEQRQAYFRTVVSLIIGGEQHQFEGVIEGTILRSPQGKKGFGYDPVFQPEGCDRSFAQMSLEEKNKISHRARAFQKLARFLKEWKQQKNTALISG